MADEPCRVLGACGRNRAGKDTALDFFVARCGAVKTGSGDLLAKALKPLGIPVGRATQQKLSTLLRLPPGPSEATLDEGGFGLDWFEYGRPKLQNPFPAFEKILRILHLEPSMPHMLRLHEMFSLPAKPFRGRVERGGFGPDMIAKALSAEISVLQAAHGRVVLSGVRRLADTREHRQRPEFRLLAVHAPIEVRYARALADPSKPDEASMTLEEFRRRDNAETENELEAVMASADFHLANDGSPQDFEAGLAGLAGTLGWPLL